MEHYRSASSGLSPKEELDKLSAQFGVKANPLPAAAHTALHKPEVAKLRDLEMAQKRNTNKFLKNNPIP